MIQVLDRVSTIYNQQCSKTAYQKRFELCFVSTMPMMWTVIRVARSIEKELNFYTGDKKRSWYSSIGRSGWLHNNFNSSSSSTKDQDQSVVKAINCGKLDVSVCSTPTTTRDRTARKDKDMAKMQIDLRKAEHYDYPDSHNSALCQKVHVVSATRFNGFATRSTELLPANFSTSQAVFSGVVQTTLWLGFCFAYSLDKHNFFFFVFRHDYRTQRQK